MPNFISGMLVGAAGVGRLMPAQDRTPWWLRPGHWYSPGDGAADEADLPRRRVAWGKVVVALLALPFAAALLVTGLVCWLAAWYITGERPRISTARLAPADTSADTEPFKPGRPRKGTQARKIPLLSEGQWDIAGETVLGRVVDMDDLPEYPGETPF